MKHRILACLLCLALLVGLVPMAAVAEEEIYSRFTVAAGETLTLSEGDYSPAENEAGSGGAGVIQPGGTLTGSDLSFFGFDAEKNGGAIWNRGTLELSGNNSFDHCSAGDKGGAILNEGTLRLAGTTVFHVTLADCGGAIYNSEGAEIYLEGSLSLFLGSLYNDGAIYWVLDDVEPGDTVSISGMSDFEDHYGNLYLSAASDQTSGKYTLGSNLYDTTGLSFGLIQGGTATGKTLSADGTSVTVGDSRYVLEVENYELVLTVSHATYQDGFGGTDYSFDDFEKDDENEWGYTFVGWYRNGEELTDITDEAPGGVYTARWEKNGHPVTTADYTILLSGGEIYKNTRDTANRIQLDGVSYDAANSRWNFENFQFATTATAALRVDGDTTLLLTGTSSLLSAGQNGTGMSLGTHTLTLAGVGTLTAFGGSCAVSGTVSTTPGMLRVGNTASWSWIAEAYDGEAFVSYQLHVHNYSGYTVTQPYPQYEMYVLSATCANEDGGHEGETTSAMMCYASYENNWQMGELVPLDGIVYWDLSGNLSEILDAESLPVYYEGTGNTVYAKTTEKPTERGTYLATVEIAGQTLPAPVTIRRNVLVEAENKTVAYGEPEAELTYLIEGLAEGEALTGVTLSREPGTEPGQYQITMTIPTEGNETFAVTEWYLGAGCYTINPVITFVNAGRPMSPVEVEYESYYKPEEPSFPGYVFLGWYTDPMLTERWDAYTEVTECATLYARWDRLEPNCYDVKTAESSHGSVCADAETAVVGQLVTLTVNPERGYTLETLLVTDASGAEISLTAAENAYTFTMPAGAVTVCASFMEDNTMLNAFFDVKTEDYFYDAVLWAVNNEISEGTGDSQFSPHSEASRAQIITLLWRAAGSPSADYLIPFTDVDEESYCGEAVRWAAAEGIVNGTEAGLFQPDSTVTRAQAVTMLHRLAGSPTVEAETGMPFADVSETAYYADAVRWAAAQGITLGTGSGFCPDAPCDRAQAVTLLYRYETLNK